MANRYLAVDTETTGTRLFHGCKPFAVSACNQSGKTWFFRCPVNADRQPQWKPKQLAEIRDLLASYPVLVFHNAKFDVRGLASIGIDLTSRWDEIRDTLLYSHVLDSSEDHGLKPLAKKYLGISDDDQQALHAATIKARRIAKKNGVKLADEVEADSWLVADELETYSIQDARRTALLYAMYVDAVKREGLTEQADREHRLMPVVYRMEQRGMRFLGATALRERINYGKVAKREADKAVKLARSCGMPADFNPRSPQQLGKLLFEKLRLPITTRTPAGQPRTDAETLESLALTNPGKPAQFLTALLLSRKAAKAAEYLTEYSSLAIREGNGLTILHGSLNQTGTRTTRFSSHDPNQQNVSVQSETPLRVVFGPRPGHYWIDADYDNIEMRLLAWASGEQRLIDLFLAGGSYHLLIAEILHGPKETWHGLNRDDWKKSPEYKSVKNGNFARGYGAGEAKTDATYGVRGAYRKLIDEFQEWSAFNRKLIREAETNGYVKTMFGYKLTTPPGREFTTALNSFIQGTAGDVIKYGMLALAEDQDFARLGGEILLTVHDELIVEFPDSADKIEAADCVKRAMESPGVKIGIPLTVTPDVVTENWTKHVPVETTHVTNFERNR